MISPRALPEGLAPFWRPFWQNDDRILLAPMEGVVDPPMRELLTAIGGVDLCITEFIRVTDRLLPKSDFLKYCPELFSATPGQTASGVPVLVQFLGGQPQPIAENAAFAAELGAPGIDLNFGCPAKTVNRHDGGASLLKTPERIHSVVSAVRRAVPAHLPVSAKVRLGFSDKEFHLAIAQAAEAGGASWLTVHARTRDEGYRPPAHWDYIRKMREATQFEVVANGEVWTVDDYHRAREVSGARHVMIGRGLVAQYDLALMIRGARQTAWAEAWPWLERLAQMSQIFRHEHYAVCRLKQALRSFTRNYPEAAAVFNDCKTLENLEPMLARLRAQASVQTSIASSFFA